jgi:hypothetical protein
MIQSSTSVSSLAALLAAGVLTAASGCSAPPTSQSSGEAVGHAAAAQTAVWTHAYVGDAHAGSINRRSNIKAKAALVMASDGTTLSLALYFCGNSATVATDTHWLSGKVPMPASGNLADLGGVTLRTKDGWSAYVNMTGPGTVTTDDNVTFEWVASYVGDNTGYGLYRYVYPSGTDTNGADLTGAVIGFIDWDSGTQGAVQRTMGTVSTAFQVTPIGPAKVIFDTAPAPVLLQPVDPIALTNATP